MAGGRDDVRREQRLGRAIANDPDFALAHIANARLLQLQARIPEARAAALRAEALRDRVSVREKRHIDAIALAVRGFATEALDVVNPQAAEFPRDARPLSWVTLDEGELELLADKGGKLAYCPSSNMVLGDGITRVTDPLLGSYSKY